jgi:hypothetical protein
VTNSRPLLTIRTSAWWGKAFAAAGVRLVSLDESRDREATGTCKWQRPTENPEVTSVSEPAQRSHVVILTNPNGHRMLSHASLLTKAEAEREAASWRHTHVPATSEPWQAEVCAVLTDTELEEAARATATGIIANWEAV